jgi:hypothetical protein
MSRIRALALATVVLGACAEPVRPGPAGPNFKTDPAGLPRHFFDQQQPLVDAGITPLALYPLDPDSTEFGVFKQNLAQTFTPEAAVELRYLYLPIACESGVLARIQLRRDGPTGFLLWDRAYDPDKFIADGEFLAFQIYGGLRLDGGVTYAFVLSALPTGSGTTCSIISAPPGDSYAGGQGFVNNPGFSPYWTPLSTFPSGPADLPFRTLVR